MSRIGDIADKTYLGATVATIGASLVAMIVSLALISKVQIDAYKALNLNPPVYRDVNADGIDDKIVQRKMLGEVLYGVDINGKRIYLPKEQFNGLKK